ncbi:hypothetical protein AAGS40_28250 (plasmid) [Paraburkholderia sp. PREW-6R]|uniref:hypothetical protein n=1 Tax=Paraburkholderia sp. PREW-6R TaxID=3141544 RepID=UPI0031F5B39A
MKLSHVLLSVACGVQLVACSRQERPSIIGHWQAERQTFFSAHLPIGPDIVISKEAVSMPGTDTRIPLNAIRQKGGETLLELPYGVGVSFFFDGPDRMHFDVPVVGSVYYDRVGDATAAQVVPQSDGKAAGAVVAGPEESPKQAVSPSVATPVALVDKPAPVPQAPPAVDVGQPGPARSSEFDQAELAARRGDQDAVIDHLNEAFRQGFKGFDKLDAAPEFATMREDVRYQALLARYR